MPPVRRPPIPAGHTRLYRGQGPIEPDRISFPTWEDPTKVGRFFTTDPAHASHFSYETKWPLWYVDVPKGLMSKLPWGTDFVQGVKGQQLSAPEVLVSRRIANQARALPPRRVNVPSVGGEFASNVLSKTGALSVLLGAIASAGQKGGPFRESEDMFRAYLHKQGKYLKGDTGPLT